VEKAAVSGQELGAWLRQQRQARGWARPEMARQLITAARRNGDTSLPGADSVCHNIYRWERGMVGVSERYRLYYCQALGIPPAVFGGGQHESRTYRIRFPAADVAEFCRLLADFVALLRELRRDCSASGEPDPGHAFPRLGNDRMTSLPDPRDVARIAESVSARAGWSIFWDKRYGVWRAAEDDPESDLYAESRDAQQVMDYIAAHSQEGNQA
jgi:transcriptional regulator with XRE-family HTH domain